MKLQRDVSVLRDAGFGVAAISYDSQAVLKEFAARKSITFPLLADHDSVVIRAYGVADRRYRKGNQLDVDTEMVYTSSLGYVPVYGLAYPSVFVIGPDRKVLWRFVSESSEFRYSAAAILHRSVGSGLHPEPPVPGKRISISPTASDLRAGLGNRVVLGVDLKIPSNLHVYAPSVGAEYRGVSWNMGDSKNCWTATDPVWPQPQWKQFDFDAAKLPVFEGTLHLERELVVAPAIQPRNPQIYKAFRDACVNERGQMRVRGAIQAQACSDRECFPPESIPVEWTIQFDPPDLERSPVDLRREFEP